MYYLLILDIFCICILEYIYIVQITQRRTSLVFTLGIQYTTNHSSWSGICMLKYALHHSRPITNVYIGNGSTCMHKGHLKIQPAFNKVREAQLVVYIYVSDYRSQGCGFESCCGEELFLFCILSLLANAHLPGRLVPYKWNKHDVHPRYIGV